MTTIIVKEINQHTFQVTVDAGSTTQHEVNVDEAYAQKLTNGKISAAKLVKQSFEFLLERESNNSILRRFNLSVISHYFPEYESIISK
ncbi:MAG: hypothetical protein V3U89_06665 [Methylophilaceae bacterium]